MKKETCFENYPASFVVLANIMQLAIYLIGAVIIYNLGLIWLVLYLIYILILEFKLLKGSCVNCYYYGKYCAFGNGKLCSLFFKKGNPKEFAKKKIKWKDLLPDFLVSLIPLIIGIILLIINFSWMLLILLILLFLLTFAGNALVRGSLACKYCKQRKLGCPAEKLFRGRK